MTKKFILRVDSKDYEDIRNIQEQKKSKSPDVKMYKSVNSFIAGLIRKEINKEKFSG